MWAHRTDDAREVSYPGRLDERLCELVTPIVRPTNVSEHLQSLQGHTTEQFFSAMIRVCAERTEKELRSPKDAKRREVRISDAFARLVVLLLKQGSPHAEIRLTLFKIVMEQIAKVLLSHYDAQKSTPGGLRNWNQRIYFRIFVAILQELRNPIRNFRTVVVCPCSRF